MKVLIVEDSGLAARLIGLVIERCGWSVAGRAGCGGEARAMALSLKPDVITLDLTLPDGGSLELIDHLSGELGIPVVVISAAAYEGSPVIAEALCRGADACVDKASIGRTGMLIETLQSAVRDRLQSHHQGACAGR